MAFNEDFAPACPNCGGPTVHFDLPNEEEHHLRTENARLRDEIGRLSQISRSHVHGGSDQDCATESDKPLIFELAVVAMEELMGMAQQREPLWVPIPDSSSEILREEEYFRTSFGGHKPNPLGFKSEASRDHAIVAMNHMNLVEILMDVNEWSSVFHGIVSKANTLEVLFAGVAGTYHGALQEISAEYQLPSPLVPTRKHYFVRYCKQQGNGTWAVVDFCPSSVPSCRKRPSGCLIQELPSGYSKVIWVEHVEIDDGEVHNANMYEDLVSSAMGFGAKRWVAILDQHCQRLASALATNIPSVEAGVITSLEGRQNIMELAERMMKSFSLGVGSSTALSWTKLSGSGADDARVMMLKNMDDPHKPPGIVLSTTSSFWMPIAPKRVFNFLRDENSRGHWDILSTGCIVQESGHIANSRDPANCISLLQVNGANWIQNNMMIMQESCTDATGSYVVYAPVDIVAINMLLNGGDPDIVALLPSGFAILPDGPPPDLNAGPTGLMDAGFGGGSLVTVAFQILVDPVPTARLSLESVAAVNNLIKSTVEKIKEALACEGA